MFYDDIFQPDNDPTWKRLSNIEKHTAYQIMLFQKKDPVERNVSPWFGGNGPIQLLVIWF